MKYITDNFIFLISEKGCRIKRGNTDIIEIKKNLNSKRFNEYKENNFLHLIDDELQFLYTNVEKGLEYYKYLIENFENLKNELNSHLMYLFGLSDNIQWITTKKNYGHVSLADIDIDMEISFRDHIIEYVREKYGEDCVAYIITFGRFDGRGAIKEVFRVLGKPFDVANRITDAMYGKDKVSDVLEDLKEDDPNYNIINYCIDHLPLVADYYEEYKYEFDIALKLANTIYSQGRHAAGIVISNNPLKEWIPTLVDENKLIVAFEMADAEYCGAVKYDFLGVAALEKIHKVLDMINFKLNEPNIDNMISYKEIENVRD